MSGIDEQDKDIPICPLCGERPKYWSIYPTTSGNTGRGWIHLLSNSYMYGGERSRQSYLDFSNLDEARSVRCKPYTSNMLSRTRHVFTEDSDMFKVVMRMARRTAT